MQPLSAEERAQLKKQKADKKDKKRKITQLDLLTDAPPEAASRNQGPRARDPAAEAEFMKSHEIVIHQQNAPPPCITLAAAPFHPLLLKLLLSQHFDQPSPIQAASWPVAAAGFDLLAIAKTGSGKTLGYLLPALTVCHENKKTARGPLALVMAPTRELAMQIQKEATKFGKPLGCRAVAVYGGAPKWEQEKLLKKGAEMIVATPGRLMDLLQLHESSSGKPSTTLEYCRVLVLDEADRMLAMGFEPDIRAIVAVMNTVMLQTLLFTATWPKAVQQVAADLLLASKVKVTVGTGGDKLTANSSVQQVVTVTDQEEKWTKFETLMEPFRLGGPSFGTRVIVFCNTKKDVNDISKHFAALKYNVDYLSGDRTQRDRVDVVKKFTKGTVTMVIATDVAARGLDIPGIDMVVNYDFPKDNIDDYVHRIGRTGRAGATGHAHTLFTPKDVKYARELVRILTEAGQTVSPELEQMMNSFVPKPPKRPKIK